MSDRRYSTALWQKLRRAVLAHYGYVCHVEGPRCTGYATTIHHLIPSSQAPHLFWEPTTLVAACRRCNYGDGSRIAAETADDRATRAIIEEQQQQIAQMAERLARYEDQAAKRRMPAIH
jgi:5-methylcytosine-specific restriction endonuclease McrA